MGIKIAEQIQTWDSAMILEALHQIPVIKFEDPTMIRGRMADTFRTELANRGLGLNLKWVGFDRAARIWGVTR